MRCKIGLDYGQVLKVVLWENLSRKILKAWQMRIYSLENWETKEIIIVKKKENKIVKDVRVGVIKFIEEQFANVNIKKLITITLNIM